MKSSPGTYQGFRGLTLWQRAQELALLVSKEVRRLPRGHECDAMVSQALKAAGSIAANIAEGYGRYYEAAYRNHLSIARGSLFETESWVDLLHRSGYIPDDVNDAIVARCHEVGRLLKSQMKALSKQAGSKAREEGATYSVEYVEMTVL